GIRMTRAPDGQNWIIERRGTGRFERPLGDGAATNRERDYPYAFVATETVSDDGTPIAETPSIRKTALYADARPSPGDAEVFPIDPASRGGPKDYRDRRPTRSEA